MVSPSIHLHQFIKIEEGDLFGIIDLVGSLFKIDKRIDKWFESKDSLRRIMSCLAISEAETMTLSLEDLYKMEQEWPLQFDEMFNNGKKRLIKALHLRKKIIRMSYDADKNQSMCESSNVNSFSFARINTEMKSKNEKMNKVNKLLCLQELDEQDSDDFTSNYDSASSAGSEESIKVNCLEYKKDYTLLKVLKSDGEHKDQHVQADTHVGELLKKIKQN